MNLESDGLELYSTDKLIAELQRRAETMIVVFHPLAKGDSVVTSWGGANGGNIVTAVGMASVMHEHLLTHAQIIMANAEDEDDD